jgi:hypothetical protein
LTGVEGRRDVDEVDRVIRGGSEDGQVVGEDDAAMGAHHTIDSSTL